jgi:predicted HAD superfamily Cof-like phosphohydrolase
MPAPPRSDIQYVLSGAVHEFGMGTRFANLFEEVHRSNMTKACKTKLEAEATVKHYMEKDGTKAHIKVRFTGRFKSAARSKLRVRLALTTLSRSLAPW